MTKLSFALLAAAALLLAASPLRAEPTTSSKAAAEALFQQGTELALAGNLPLACQKFEASQKLDPALGTMLRWADCLDRSGKSASAWALFQEATALANTRGDADRARIAEQRAQYLKDNLALLELKRGASDVEQGLVVRVNDATIPRESLNTPLPVDPGETLVELGAPGFKTWSTKLTVKTGPSRQELVLPRLVPLPRAKHTARATPRATTSTPSSAYRTAGLITGVTGIVGLAGSALLGLRAADLGADSRAHCQAENPNRCDETGYSLREEALTFADAATLSGAVGGALVLIGIGVFVFAPDESSEVGAVAAPGRAGLELRGKF